MKIEEKALEYLKEKKIDYLVIKTTMNVSFQGCGCAGGTEAFIDPIIETGSGDFDEAKYFIFEDISGIKVYISKTIYDKIKNCEIYLDNKIIYKKLKVKGYVGKNINVI